MWCILEDGAGNSGVVTYGENAWEDDVNDILDGSWQNWYIRLSDYAADGVDLTDVNAIAIGFGDRTDTVSGGNGNVYFDNIRITCPVCVLAARDAAFAARLRRRLRCQL
jgi:hypothetical protein